MNSALKWGLIAVGGYLIYTNFFAAPAAAAAGSGSGAGAPAAGGTSTAPAPATAGGATLVSLLGDAAKSDPAYVAGGGKMNADQWSYYYGRLAGRSAISPAAFSAAFFPNGRPAGDAPTMAASDFVAAIATRGLSGLGRAVPRLLTVPALNAIRRAAALRGSNYVRRGTPMVGG